MRPATLIATALPRPALLATALLTALAGCKSGETGPPGAASSTAAAAAPIDPAATARRPTRRYYLGRTETRCEIYAVDLDGVTPPIPTPCPLELQVGERIRIAGKTCTRDSNDPDRREPVVCPDPLTNLEKQDRAGKH